MPDYFGVLEIYPGGTRGRIRVLARLTKLQGVLVAAEDFHIEDEIGHTKKVFVTFNPRTPGLNFTDQMFVKFEPVESNRPVEPGQDIDRLVVINQNRIEPFGFCMIHESQVAWRKEPRRVDGAPPGATVYVDAHQQGKRVFIGPWTVRQTAEGLILHVPDNHNYVLSYPYEAIDPRSIIHDQGSRDGGRECLLEHPPPNLAEPIDLAPGRSLGSVN